MKLTQERVEECIDCVMNDSELYYFLKRINGTDAENNEIHRFVSAVVKSILVKMISDQRKNYIYYEDAKTFANGIKDFFDIFDCNFVTKDILLKQMRQYCKNYVFYAEDRINDYSIFYFTFKLFDYYCQNCRKKIDIVEEAARFAKNAYIFLKRPYKKTPLVVTCQSLFEYIDQFSIDIPTKHIYTFIFINFIQALYNSQKLDDVTRYAFFERFSEHIVKLDLLLGSGLFESHKSFMIELGDNKKINKSISNKKQYLLSKGENEKVRQLEKFRSIYKKLPQSSKEMAKKSEKELQNTFSKVFELISNKDNLENEFFLDLFNDYISMTYNENGEETSLQNVVIEGIKSQVAYSLHKLQIDYKNSPDNIYIQLILQETPSMKIVYVDPNAYRKFCNLVILYIIECVDEMFYLKESYETVENYKTAIGKVNLKEIGVPILSFDISSDIIDYRLRSISAAIV